MSHERGTAERPLATQVENLLASSSVPKAEWADQKLTRDGYRVMIYGGGCVEVAYVGSDAPLEERQSHLTQLMQLLQGHYGDETVEIQGSVWKVDIESTRLMSEYPTIYARLRWIRSV
ncbi:MAG TPA: hypothetical protein VJM32_04045 [Candidatus Saccharimonadales bacterium]|nr:hypothetical protein [Candidatus Saccharimonadales bacterium]